MGARPEGSAAGAGWKVAVIGILIAVVMGAITIAVGARKIRRGEQMQKEAESRLLIALDYATEQASNEAKSVDDALLKSNWGDAGIRLSRLSAAVSLMEQVAPFSKRPAVADVKEALGRVQGAVAQQSKDWRDQLDTLRGAIDQLRAEE